MDTYEYIIWIHVKPVWLKDFCSVCAQQQAPCVCCFPSAYCNFAAFLRDSHPFCTLYLCCIFEMDATVAAHIKQLLAGAAIDKEEADQWKATVGDNFKTIEKN